MKNKHTPGLWQWWDESTGRPPKYDLHKLIGKYGRMVLSGYGREGNNALGRSTEDQANARLIAAAPELLVALEAMVAAHNSVKKGCRLSAIDLYQAKEAIAKAKEAAP